MENNGAKISEEGADRGTRFENPTAPETIGHDPRRLRRAPHYCILNATSLAVQNGTIEAQFYDTGAEVRSFTATLDEVTVAILSKATSRHYQIP